MPDGRRTGVRRSRRPTLLRGVWTRRPLCPSLSVLWWASFSPGEGRGEVVTSEGDSIPGKRFHYGRSSDRRADRHPTGSSPARNRLSDRRGNGTRPALRQRRTGSLTGVLTSTRPALRQRGTGSLTGALTSTRPALRQRGTGSLTGTPTGTRPALRRCMTGSLIDARIDDILPDLHPRSKKEDFLRKKRQLIVGRFHREPGFPTGAGSVPPKTIGKYQRRAATTQRVKLRVQIMTHSNEALVSKRHFVRSLI